MEAYAPRLAEPAVRWAHVIVGIAWIGASFYFIWLDNHLEPSRDPKLAGELWAVHGGGFYHAREIQARAAGGCRRRCTGSSGRRTGPGITGFALLVVMYYGNAELYLIDPAVMPLSKAAAIGIGLGVARRQHGRLRRPVPLAAGQERQRSSR